MDSEAQLEKQIAHQYQIIMIWASFGAKGPEHFAVIESTTISGGVMQQDNVITEWLKEKNQGVAMIQTSMN